MLGVFSIECDAGSNTLSAPPLLPKYKPHHADKALVRGCICPVQIYQPPLEYQ